MKTFLVEFPKLNKKFVIHSQDEPTAQKWSQKQLEVLKVNKTRTVVTEIVK